MNIDQQLFKELDKFSEPLRRMANDITNLYKQLPTRSPEIDITMLALQKLNSSPIDRMDIAVNEVKDAFLLLSIKIKNDSQFLNSPIFHTILEKNFLLVQKINDLEARALELNRSCQD